MKTILITRPRVMAEPLAKRLKGEGYHPVLEPLMTLVPEFLNMPSIPEHVAVIITSRVVFSVMAARRRALEPLFDKPCYCVGTRTGAEARSFGFRDVRIGEGDGLSLAQLILKRESPQTPLLHISGEIISREVYDRLSAAGRHILSWKVYKAEAVQDVSAELKDMFEKKAIDSTLFFSPRTAQIFSEIFKREGLENTVKNTSAIVMSDAVAAPLAFMPWQRILVADMPTEEMVLELLFRFIPVL